MEERRNGYVKMQLDIADIKSNVKHMTEIFTTKVESFDEHVKESSKVRMQIHDNTKFRNNGVKAIWVIIVATIGSFIRFEFFGK